MSNNNLHELVTVQLEFPKQSSGQIQRKLKELGATLHYDVYSFERETKGPLWQSESLIYIANFLEGNEVDAQSPSNKLELQYPLATLGAEFISSFAQKVMEVARAFNSRPQLQSGYVDENEIIRYCENCVTELMENWGEEPGSKAIRILIESHYK